MFSHTHLLEWVCLWECGLFEKMLQIHLRNKQCNGGFLMFCRYIVPTRVLVCLCNEMRAKMCSLSGCFKRWLLYGGFFCYYCVLSSVCILKRPFSLHNFRQYTNICARVCLCFFADASCLSLSSHYFCFVFFFCFDYQWEKNTFVLCDTFTLFSSFLDGKSKNSKRKSSAIFV